MASTQYSEHGECAIVVVVHCEKWLRSFSTRQEYEGLDTVISEKWLFRFLSSSDSLFTGESDAALGEYADEGLLGKVGRRFSSAVPAQPGSLSFPSTFLAVIGQVGVFCCDGASLSVSKA